MIYDTPSVQSTPESNSSVEEMKGSIGSLETTAHSFSLLLELAADNDVEGFKRSVCDESEVGEVGIWYGREALSKKMILEHRTPLMVAAKYGSLDVVKLILLLPDIDVNFCCGLDKTTALHCAASGGSINAFNVVKMLLLAGADPNAVDANGHRPVDVVVSPPNSPYSKVDFEELLGNGGSACQKDLQASSDSLSSSSLPLSLSSEESLLSSSADTFKPFDAKVYPAEKEYSADHSPFDINSSVYTTDEFRMFSFKVHPCSRAYNHDWTECPFVHPGENARRRDPRRFHYSCVPCPDYRKGACRRGDFCEYAHGIFECWLHPAQYRTRFCKDGTTCKRRVCFFAHSSAELRPLYTFAVPSPFPQAAATDCTAASNMLPGSPLAAVSEPCTPPPLSPSSNMSHSARAWHQQIAPGRDGYFQASRLRAALSARDIPSEELNTLWDYELQQQQLLNEMSCIFEPLNCINSTNPSACPTTNSQNPDKLSSTEVFSIFSPPSYKLAVLSRPKQQRNKFGPINKPVLSPKNVNHPTLQASLGSSSPGSTSPRTSKSMFSMECQLSSPAHWAEEPDVSWVHSVLKESSQEITTNPVSHTNSNPQIECNDVSLQAWLDGLQLDQIVAQ